MLTQFGGNISLLLSELTPPLIEEANIGPDAAMATILY
jgi:hypothetical protein